ncbi:hypothetical protein JMA_37840 (plasmid) [Jeotgalibacillus malaysiensis]|uniref:Uncharacterized protein n=1 Tax=Jeotgalibacillus malaysiensis TaxID=1508404 RepID=A0A0B5AWK9_9BACL|nr:hypothetical protein [Jeotgalibacillus malaysiensis]AJD93102.1 hypothetical protein JMA_37840 [Jeotgalibacillus malaysiensis]
MCLGKEMDFRTVNDFKAHEWAALYLGMDGECVSTLEMGRLKLYWDVVHDGEVQDTETLGILTYEAMQMNPSVLDAIEESEEKGVALSDVSHYEWQETPYLIPVFSYLDETTFERLEDLEITGFVGSELWMKLKTIEAVKKIGAGLEEWEKEKMTDEEKAQFKAFETMDGFSIPVSKLYTEEEFVYSIQHSIAQQDDFINYIPYLECHAEKGMCTLIWQTNVPSISNWLKQELPKKYQKLL